jgi:hypothetical protein
MFTKNLFQKNKTTNIIMTVMVMIVVGMMPVQLFAAGFTVAPSTVTNQVGKTFTVNVNISTTGQVMNAASGSLSFSKDVIEVVSVSKSGSIFNLWVQEPQYSNAMGVVSFEGIVLNPGFSGTGKILSITFRAKNAGTGKFSFSNGSILANDGNGTNILKELGTGSVTITPVITPPEPVKAVPVSSTASNIITSASTDGMITEEIPLIPVSSTPIVTLQQPMVTSYPSLIKKGEPVVFSGTSLYPDATILIRITQGETILREFPTQTDSNGTFIYALEKPLSKGVYQFSVQITDTQGMSSIPTQKNTFVIQSAQLITVGEHVLSMITIVLGIGALLFLIAALTVQAWFALGRMRRKISRHVIEAESEVHEAFSVLQDTMKEQIMLLEITRKHRTLTEEEKVVLKSIQKNIKKMEEFVLEDLEKIKRDV